MINKSNSDIDIALDYMKVFIKIPYVWGSNNILLGTDCSNYVLEYLRCLNIVNKNYDDTAKGIFNKFKQHIVNEPKKGYVVFYGKSADEINHTEICLSANLAIGASGGDSDTVSASQACLHNAFVKVRSIARMPVVGYLAIGE